MRNKYVAALLAFLGGSIGLHKFYLRQTGAGVFYAFLMIMTVDFFPISAFLGFIDAIRYLMMPKEEFDRKFNRTYSTRRTKSTRNRQRRQRETYEVNMPQKSGRKAPKVRNNPFKKSGMKKYREYEIEEAIDDFHKGLKIEPNDVALHFNLACAYSLMEDKDAAFNHLDAAIGNGLKDKQKILSHDDLAFVRIQPEFDEFKENGFRVSRKKIKEQAEAKSANTQAKQPMDDILLAQLNRLMELRKKGVLTEQEFTIERKKILLR